MQAESQSDLTYKDNPTRKEENTMRYTEPTILNVSKAVPMIMSTSSKNLENTDSISPFVRTDPTAYEADE
jgi:hypothetical protein